VSENGTLRSERPDAFRLRPTNPASLIGRDEDLVRLITCVNHKRLVLVDIASGCGKPALVSAGRVPSLRQSDSPLPIAIRDWGDDWARGPLSAAVEGLFHGVSQTDRDRLGWTSSPIQGVPERALPFPAENAEPQGIGALTNY